MPDNLRGFRAQVAKVKLRIGKVKEVSLINFFLVGLCCCGLYPHEVVLDFTDNSIGSKTQLLSDQIKQASKF